MLSLLGYTRALTSTAKLCPPAGPMPQLQHRCGAAALWRPAPPQRPASGGGRRRRPGSGMRRPPWHRRRSCCGARPGSACSCCGGTRYPGRSGPASPSPFDPIPFDTQPVPDHCFHKLVVLCNVRGTNVRFLLYPLHGAFDFGTSFKIAGCQALLF